MGLLSLHPIGVDAVKHFIKGNGDLKKLNEIIENQIIKKIDFNGKNYYMMVDAPQVEMTGRKRGRCKETKTIQTEKTTDQSAENKEVVYGLGRGGKPRGGGGLGNHHGGGKGKGQGFRNR